MELWEGVEFFIIAKYFNASLISIAVTGNYIMYALGPFSRKRRSHIYDSPDRSAGLQQTEVNMLTFDDCLRVIRKKKRKKVHT